MTAGPEAPAPIDDLDAVDGLDRLLGSTPVEHHLVERTWGEQHIVTAGPAAAPAVLLVHGWPQHWLAWRHVIAALAPTRRVVAVDVRGFGWSSCEAPGGITIGELAADLPLALDHLGIGSAVLASHDWGGWLAFRATQDAPHRFRHHCALGIVPPWLDRGVMVRHLLDWVYVVPMALAGDRIARSPAAVRWLVDHSTHHRIWGRPDDRAALASYLERIGRPGSAAMTRHLYATLVRHELPAAWGPRHHTLAVPTTVVVGEHETIARPELFWDRTAPGEIRVVTVPGARHWVAEERPDAVIDRLGTMV